VLTLEAL